jgi:hypothetical protein
MIVPQSLSDAGSIRTRRGRATSWALASMFSAALVVVGIGGPVAAQDESQAPTDAVQSLLEELDLGSGAAAVVLGDERYDFISATETSDSTIYLGVCQEVFGIIAANLHLTDAREIRVDIQIPPVDWDNYDDGRYGPPRVHIQFDDPYQTWIADAEWATDNGVDGQSQVDTFERDGSSATGTATFLEQRSMFADRRANRCRGRSRSAAQKSRGRCTGHGRRRHVPQDAAACQSAVPTTQSGSPSMSTSTSIPRPGPDGTGPQPPALRG